MMRSVLPCLVLVGCGGGAGDSSTSCTPSDDGYAMFYEDRDGDGAGSADASQATCDGQPPFPTWVATDGDCDDTDDTRFPGNPELCNGLDDDCDDQADEGLPFVDYYVDGDADGYGSGTATNACSDPGTGFATLAGDCDDGDDQVNPGAAEVCNGYDDNCADGTDEGDPVALCADDAPGSSCEFGRCLCDPVPVSEGASCEEAIDLGSIVEGDPAEVRTFNALPAYREVWYKFRGVDANGGAESGDPGMDEYHVRVWLIDNPDDRFEQTVYQRCGDPPINDRWTFFVGDNDFEDVLDTRATRDGVRYGEAPCSQPGTSIIGLDTCSDNSMDYYVRVKRVDAADLACVSGTIEFSNGVYSAQ